MPQHAAECRSMPQNAAACRSMPQNAAACRSTANFSRGPLVPGPLLSTEQHGGHCVVWGGGRGGGGGLLAMPSSWWGSHASHAPHRILPTSEGRHGRHPVGLTTALPQRPSDSSGQRGRLSPKVFQRLAQSSPTDRGYAPMVHTNEPLSGTSIHVVRVGASAIPTPGMRSGLLRVVLPSS